MSALMTALHEGGIDAALTYLEAVMDERDELRRKVADHDGRVTELLLANNVEVERCRDLTRRMREASEMVGDLYDLGDFRTEGESPVTNMDAGTYKACQLAAKIEKLLEVE